MNYLREKLNMDSIHAALNRGAEAFLAGIDPDQNPYATENDQPKPGCTAQQVRAWQRGWEAEQQNMCELAQ